MFAMKNQKHLLLKCKVDECIYFQLNLARFSMLLYIIKALCKKLLFDYKVIELTFFLSCKKYNVDGEEKEKKHIHIKIQNGLKKLIMDETANKLL